VLEQKQGLVCIIIIFLFFNYFFDPGTQFPENEKIMLCNIIIIIIITIHAE